MPHSQSQSCQIGGAWTGPLWVGMTGLMSWAGQNTSIVWEWEGKRCSTEIVEKENSEKMKCWNRKCQVYGLENECRVLTKFMTICIFAIMMNISAKNVFQKQGVKMCLRFSLFQVRKD